MLLSHLSVVKSGHGQGYQGSQGAFVPGPEGPTSRLVHQEISPKGPNRPPAHHPKAAKAKDQESEPYRAVQPVKFPEVEGRVKNQDDSYGTGDKTREADKGEGKRPFGFHKSMITE